MFGEEATMQEFTRGLETAAAPVGGIPPAAAAGEPQAATARSTCYFAAQMPNQVAVGQLTALSVTISRELLAPPPSATSAAGSGAIDERQNLMVVVMPKANFEVVGDYWAQVTPPKPLKPAQLVFQVRATHASEGELWVTIFQGTAPVANLSLRPTIVAAG